MPPCSPLAMRLGNAFVSGAESLRFKSLAGKSNTVMLKAAHRCKTSLKGDMLSRYNDEEMVLQIRYTLRCNTASIMKKLILITKIQFECKMPPFYLIPKPQVVETPNFKFGKQARVHQACLEKLVVNYDVIIETLWPYFCKTKSFLAMTSQAV